MPRKRPQKKEEQDPTRVENAIPRAIRSGDRDQLAEQFSQAERNGLLTDSVLRTALRVARDCDDIESMRLLLGHAKPYHVNERHAKTKATLLMGVKSREMAQLLIHADAEVNAVDAFGCSALMQAASKGVVVALLDAGADRETGKGQARSALMHMVMQDRPSTLTARTDVALHLIDIGADLEAPDRQGRTILMTAIWRNLVSVVKALFAKGVSLDAVDHRGRNALHHLCEDRERSRRMMTSVKDTDKSMIDLVVNSKVLINAEDAFESKTPLHRAVENNNTYLVRALLDRPQVNVDITDLRNKTPLHTAAANAHEEILKLLLDKGADPRAMSDGCWTPLHNAAAGNGKDHVKVVKMLLLRGVSAGAKLRNGKTALHLACEAGDLEVVKLLREQPGVNIMARDSEGNTPLISAAKLGQSHVVKHLTPLSHASAWSEDAIKASKSFLATIVDFSSERKNGNRRQNKRIYDLMFENYPLSPNAPTNSSASDIPRSKRFRWIHLPSNNITWCQELLLRRFAEQDGADAEGFKALEKSFNYQHRGTRVHAHYMRPMCQIVPQTHSKDDDNYSESESIGNESVAVQSSAGSIPSHPGHGRHESKATKAEKKFKRSRPDRESSDMTQNDEVAAAAGDDDRTAASRPASDDLQSSNMFCFAPYLHYETHGKRKEMQDAIKLATSRKMSLSQTGQAARPKSAEGLKYDRDYMDADKNLICSNVDTVSCSMNVRRTLDQYYYRTIDTSKYRDHDQVIHRYQQKHRLVDKTNDIRVLMVDQLWMWVVGKDLVVTSFPQRWQQPRDDLHNILENIISEINMPGRAPVSSVYELAFTIATRCFGPFDRRNISEGEMLFLDMFESTIGDAMDRETELFRAFKKASKEASRWLKVLTSPAKADYMFEQTIRAPKLEKDQTAGTDEKKNKVKGPKPTLVRTLLDIGEETRLMREIKDIRDELNMLRMIFQEQKKQLSGLRQTLLEMIKRDDGTGKFDKTIRRIHDDAMPVIVHPLQDIDRMDLQAERIYNSVRDLLDLKQNYAISMQAADTARQGRTLMVFTVVTVIFLPLSFLTAFFALDIKDFPHTDDGNQELPLGFVSKYIFGVGFAIALLSVLLALAWERLGLQFRRARRQMWHLIHERRHEQSDSAGGGSQPDGLVRVPTGLSARSDATARSSVEQLQRRVTFTDVEQGVG